MKKVLVYLLAAVMVLSLVGVLNIASPLKAAAESANLALNKPVTEELEEGTSSMGDPYWGIACLTDGSRFDTTEYDAGNQPVDTRYGWYVIKVGEDPMNASAVIDLQAAYDVCRIKLYTEYHFLGTKFPNTYDVYLSADGSSWTKVISVSGRSDFLTHALEYEFDKVNARYVKFTIVKGNDIVDDAEDGGFIQYAGLGEIEVYDTYTSGNIAMFKTATETKDPAVNTWVLGNSGQWDDHAVVGPSVPYAFGPYNMTGWIAVAATEDAEMRLDVDLHGKYKINKINLVPMPWSNTGNDDAGWYFPNTYDVLISVDGSNWTSVYKGENESTVGVKGKTRTIEFSEKEASYVRLAINKGTATGNGDFGTGLGGHEVYGAYAVTVPEDTQPATEPAGGIRDFSTADNGDLMSYDQILVNGAEIANGNDAVIAAKALVDGSDGSVQTIAMHGWYGNKNSKIESFGYMIDSKAPVFGDFKVDAEQAVIDAGGEYRYTITVDVSGLTDGKTHKIQAVVKLENGDIVKMNRNADGKDRDAYVNYKAQYVQETQPATGDMTVAMFAVVAVLAMGAAVVFAKKRAF